MNSPLWVEKVLGSPLTGLIARLLLVSDFLVGGLEKLLDFPAACAEMQRFGLHPGALWAMLAIGVELVGPALIIVGRYVWLGAGALGVLTVVAAMVAHPFWTLSGQAQSLDANGFMEDLGLIAGFLLVARASPNRQGSVIPIPVTHHVR